MVEAEQAQHEKQADPTEVNPRAWITASLSTTRGRPLREVGLGHLPRLRYRERFLLRLDL